MRLNQYGGEATRLENVNESDIFSGLSGLEHDFLFCAVLNYPFLSLGSLVNLENVYFMHWARAMFIN